MIKELTALYDLAISPPTFDFSYAVVQSELERQRRGCDSLTFYVRNDSSLEGVTGHSKSEADWRLRHVIAPLSQLLPRPAALIVGASPPTGCEVFSRPHGLHWLSDVSALAEAGEDVQVLAAQPNAKIAVEGRLRDVVAGRRLITITLRETRYGMSRNSNMLAWASLARTLSAEDYAVVVLRDHERVSEPLPGDWGRAVTLPAAVWNLQWRAALYEMAWLNLGVNNGPVSMALLNSRVRLLIFKMLGGTPETTPQHCRKLGLEPGGTLAFLKPHQKLVWDIDEVGVLHEHVFAALADIETGISITPPARSVAECIVAAARRDYRAARSTAGDLARIPAGPVRTASAIERAEMLLDEGHAYEAAITLREAPPGRRRAAFAASIAHAEPVSQIVELLAPLMVGAETADWKAALSRAAGSPKVKTAGSRKIKPVGKSHASPIPKALVVEVDGLDKFGDVLIRLAAAEEHRRQSGLDALNLVVNNGNESGLAAAALFPNVTAFTLRHGIAAAANARATPGFTPNTSRTVAATIPHRAKNQFQSWRHAQGFGPLGYAVFGPSPDADAPPWTRASDAASMRGLDVVDWVTMTQMWPIEMLAALLDGAAVRVIDEFLATTLAGVLGLTTISPATFIKELDLL